MSRSTWTLLAILVLLLGVAVIVMQRPGEHAGGDTNGKMLVNFDSAAVDRIELHSTEGSVTLKKDNGAWMLETPLRYRADQSAVAALIGKARSIPEKNVVSSNAERFGLFKVDSTGTSVRLSAGNSLLASFIVGKPSSSFTETYVRKDGSSDVILAEGMFAYTFSRGANDWRDKAILTVRQEEIQSVRFSYGDTTFALVRADSGWTIDGAKATGASIDRLVGALGGFAADGFIDTTFSPPQSPTETVSVNGVDLRFYKQTGNYSVQSSLTPQWYVVNDWKAQGILKRKSDLVPAVAASAR